MAEQDNRVSQGQHPTVRLGEPFSIGLTDEQFLGISRNRISNTFFEIEGVGKASIGFRRDDEYDDIIPEATATPAGPVEVKSLFRGGEEPKSISLPIVLACVAIECQTREQAEQIRCQFICGDSTWKIGEIDENALNEGSLHIYEWRERDNDKPKLCFFPDDLNVLNRLSFTISQNPT